MTDTCPVVVASAWSSRLGGAGRTVIGLGVDLVNVAAVEDLLASGGEAFALEAWTETERSDSAADPERLAARWAGKEAVLKALELGFGPIAPLDVEVRLDSASGIPRVQLYDLAQQAATALGVEEWRISLSHDAGWAVAFAVALGRREIEG